MKKIYFFYLTKNQNHFYKLVISLFKSDEIISCYVAIRVRPHFIQTESERTEVETSSETKVIRCSAETEKLDQLWSKSRWSIKASTRSLTYILLNKIILYFKVFRNYWRKRLFPVFNSCRRDFTRFFSFTRYKIIYSTLVTDLKILR